MKTRALCDENDNLKMVEMEVGIGHKGTEQKRTKKHGNGIEMEWNGMEMEMEWNGNGCDSQKAKSTQTVSLFWPASGKLFIFLLFNLIVDGLIIRILCRILCIGILDWDFIAIELLSVMKSVVTLR